MVRETLERKVEMRIGSRVRKVSRIEALIMKQVELATKGEHRALMALVQAYRQAVPEPIEAPPMEELKPIDADISATGQAILEMFAESIREEAAATLSGQEVE